MNTRQHVVNWMMEMADQCLLHSYTMHYAVTLFDVVSNKLSSLSVRDADNQEIETAKSVKQRVGNIAMICFKLSSYMNEMFPVALSDCMCADYSRPLRDQLLATEKEILETMDYNFAKIDTYHQYAIALLPMSRPFSEADAYLKYVMDMCLLSFDFCDVYPRIVAQACVLVVLDRYKDCVVQGVIDMAAVEMKERVKQAMANVLKNKEYYTHFQFEKNMKKVTRRP